MHHELVRRAMTGDHEAFTKLVDASIDRQYVLALAILRNRDRAQDAVQDALVSAWRDVRSLRDPGAWDAWLHRLTVWACYRLARKDRRRTVVELHLVPDPEPADEGDPYARVADREQLDRTLGSLPVDLRAIVVLHYHLDRPLTDVAAILDLPLGTVKSRLHRALEMLRSALDERQDGALHTGRRTA
jgi:RNA polymerase sigma-70 factor (ECF subfamily)